MTQKNLDYYLNLNWTLIEGEDLDFEGKPYHYIMIEEIPSFCFCAKTIEKARENLNDDLEIISSGLAVIPTEWKTEILCYEFKGKVEDKEFLVYINAENGREEDILIITNTPNGILAM